MLQLLVKSVDLEVLRDHIIAGLPAASQQVHELLAAALEPLRKGPMSVRHCCRCHTEYDESINHSRGCVIPHAAVIEPEGHGEPINWAICCLQPFYEGDEDSADAFCFRGRHTNNVADVERYHVPDKTLVRWQARMDAFDQFSKRGEHEGKVFKSCAQAGCK